MKRPNPHFFKILYGDFMNYMKIPPKFHEHLQDETEFKPSSSNPIPAFPASLVGPTGKTYDVIILKTKKDMFFTRGWARFVMDHSLKEHEMLIFRYNGSLQFNVIIFDKTACEKQGFGGNVYVNELCSDAEPIETDFSEDKSDEEYNEEPIETDKEPTESDSSEDKSDEEYNGEPDFKKASKGIKRRRPVVTEMKKKNAQKTANSFISKNPFFIVHLKPSHVFCSSKLRFPIEFSNKYLPRSKCEFTLRVSNSNNDKTWEVNYISSDKERNRFCKGWVLFARENLLEPDDFCAFELINPTEFQVHIFRVSDLGENEDVNKYFDKTDCEKKGFGPSGGNECVNELSFDEEPIEADSHSSEGKSDEECNEEPDFKKSSKGIKRRRSPVTKMEKKNAQKAANSFISENPFFIVHLKPSHIYCSSKLRFPPEFSNKYLPRSKCEFILRVSNSKNDKTWEVNYIPSDKERDRFCKGWVLFARENLLEPDDFCAFELINPAEFQVHIFRVLGLGENEDANKYFDKRLIETDSNEDDNEEQVRKKSGKSKGIKRRRPVGTEMEKETAQKAAESFASENPFFTIQLKPSHVYSWSKLRFPTEFSNKYLPKTKCEFILRDAKSNKTWEVNYNPSVKERDRLCKGWPLFARDNLLEADDFCAFELVNPTEFLVHFFRVGDSV